MSSNIPGANYHSVYEAGYCGFWIHEALHDAGINNIVINPADVPTKDKERQRKNNRVDARKLARSLRSGDLEPIHVHNRQLLEHRFLIRMRCDAVKQQTRYKNKIKGELNFMALSSRTSWLTPVGRAPLSTGSKTSPWSSQPARRRSAI